MINEISPDGEEGERSRAVAVDASRLHLRDRRAVPPDRKADVANSRDLDKNLAKDEEIGDDDEDRKSVV